jgi:hypothetical protein
VADHIDHAHGRKISGRSGGCQGVCERALVFGACFRVPSCLFWTASREKNGLNRGLEFLCRRGFLEDPRLRQTGDRFERVARSR